MEIDNIKQIAKAHDYKREIIDKLINYHRKLKTSIQQNVKLNNLYVCFEYRTQVKYKLKRESSKYRITLIYIYKFVHFEKKQFPNNEELKVIMKTQVHKI